MIHIMIGPVLVYALQMEIYFYGAYLQAVS